MPSHDRIREVLESKQTVERLVAIEHERWAHWQRYVHDQCERQEDGSLVVPAELAGRWEIQIATPLHRAVQTGAGKRPRSGTQVSAHHHRRSRPMTPDTQASVALIDSPRPNHRSGGKMITACSTNCVVSNTWMNGRRR